MFKQPMISSSPHPSILGSLDKSKKNLTCGGLEDKMGIHGSSTCVMNFDETTGYLIGKERDGLHQMFTFMNTARIGTALQGLGAAELAYQGVLLSDWPENEY